MKILVLGSGLMGPAAAYNALCDASVTQVTLCDVDQTQLEAARAKLATLGQSVRLVTVSLDLNNQSVATAMMAEHDVIIAALPNVVIRTGLGAAIAARKPWVDLSWPPAAEVAELETKVTAAGMLVIPGCGVEPGLTEIWARHLAESLDQVDELHIKCGGIPTRPTPPLGYKIVFGGRRLPLRPYPAPVVKHGQLTTVPRYSEVEQTFFEGVGVVEAWHEGFMPWLLELNALHGLKTGAQKTVRWPGYAAKVTVLNEMGLLSDTPIEVDGVQIAPKRFLDTLLYPHVRMEEADRDITCFRVEVMGRRDGKRLLCSAEMVDRFDEVHGFTSMARVTAFTGAIVARMVARGEINTKGWQTPEKLITGNAFEHLIRELAAVHIRFTVLEKVLEG